MWRLVAHSHGSKQELLGNILPLMFDAKMQVCAVVKK